MMHVILRREDYLVGRMIEDCLREMGPGRDSRRRGAWLPAPAGL